MLVRRLFTRSKARATGHRYHDIYPTPAVPQRRRFSRARMPVAVALIASIAAGALWTRTAIHADTVTMYPTACLGGWKNSERAQGPLSADAAQIQGFTEEKTAMLPENTIAEIYCGGFSADIPPRSSPTSLTLLVSWSTELDEGPVISGDTFASSTGDILDAPAGTSPTFKLEEGPAESEAAQDVPPSAAPEPAPVSSALDSEQETVSFFGNLIPAAYAQEAEGQEGAGNTDAPSETPAREAPVQPAAAVLFEEPGVLEGTAGAATDESSISSTSPPAEEQVPDNAFIEVRYTLNGTEWNSLGTYDAVHIVPTTFSIPLPEHATWSDLSSFQISITSRSVLDEAPPVYLDGMELRTGYDETKDPFYADKTLYSTDDVITLTSQVPRSAVQIYWLDDPSTAPQASQVYAAIVGDDGTVKLETKTLFPGNFELVNTTTRWHCSNLYLSDCIARGSLGSITISVMTPEQRAQQASSTVASTTPPLGEDNVAPTSGTASMATTSVEIAPEILQEP